MYVIQQKTQEHKPDSNCNHYYTVIRSTKAILNTKTITKTAATTNTLNTETQARQYEILK